MGVPESSTPPAPKPGPKTSSAARRDRRFRVESLLIDGVPTVRLCALVSEQFGVSPRMVRKDIRRVKKRWDAEDEDYLGPLKRNTIRSLVRNAEQCQAAGDRAGERDARWKIGRLIGMGNELTLNVRGKVRHEHVVETPSTWMAELARVFAEQGRLPAVVPAEVVPTTNGHAKEGEHAA